MASEHKSEEDKGLLERANERLAEEGGQMRREMQEKSPAEAMKDDSVKDDLGVGDDEEGQDSGK